jgi:hypothetical protein
LFFSDAEERDNPAILNRSQPLSSVVADPGGRKKDLISLDFLITSAHRSPFFSRSLYQKNPEVSNRGENEGRSYKGLKIIL